ncbi:MAG: hypothetical protein COA59_17230 [Colwellia sp.]|nr:MAG: hypothetical protein COA59_17230 [Colwellia sp.]
MAVINCPSCKKKISDKAIKCSHCGLSLQEIDSDKIANLNNVSRINQAQRLMTYSFIAMLLFCGGFLLMFWDNVEQGTWQHNLALASTVIGFILYIIVRIQLLFFKRQK